MPFNRHITILGYKKVERAAVSYKHGLILRIFVLLQKSDSRCGHMDSLCSFPVLAWLHVGKDVAFWHDATECFVVLGDINTECILALFCNTFFPQVNLR